MTGSAPLELWGGLECSVVRLGDEYRNQIIETGHVARMSDIDAMVDLGIKAVRYPILWERTAPDGIAAANLIGAVEGPRSELLRSMHATWSSVFDDVTLDGVHAASLALGDAFLDALGPDADVVTPREHPRRGGHLAVRVRDAPALCAALARTGVIADARPPELLRFGFASPYVTLDDAVTAARALRALL